MNPPTKATNLDLFLQEDAELQSFLSKYPCLQEIEELLDRYGAVHFDRRSQSDRNHTRFRVLKAVHALFFELQDTKAQLELQMAQILARDQELDSLRPFRQQQLSLKEPKPE